MEIQICIVLEDFGIMNNLFSYLCVLGFLSFTHFLAIYNPLTGLTITRRSLVGLVCRIHTRLRKFCDLELIIDPLQLDLFLVRPI